MESLGDQILAKILREVPRGDELKLFKVCKRWYKLMDETVGIRVTIGRMVENAFSRQQIIPDSMKILGKRGIRSCEINCLINETALLPNLKHPDLLEFVSFKNFVSTESLKSILTGVKSLHTFQIDHQAIFHLDFADLSLCLPCEVLDLSFNRYFRSLSRPEHENWTHETLNNNTVHLLRSFEFPGLKKILGCFATPENTFAYASVPAELIAFLGRHAESLEKVEIMLVSRKLWTDTVEIPNVDTPPASSLEVQQQIQAAQFNKLRRVSIVDEPSVKKRTDWMNWIMKIENLEIVNPIYNICSVNVERCILDQNEMSITKIDISLSLWTQPLLVHSFDCAVLKNCFKLIDLRIRGLGFSRLIDSYNGTLKGLLNAEQLPKSIVNLLISQVPITCETCEFICLQLPALENLSLSLRTSSSESQLGLGYGVPRDVVKEMIEQKKLKTFVICVGTRIEQDYTHDKQIDSAFNVNNHRILGTLQMNGVYKLITIEPGTVFRREKNVKVMDEYV